MKINWYKLMTGCWKISEAHWVFIPFEWIGNFIEDYKFNTFDCLADDVKEAILEAYKDLKHI